HMAGHLVVGQTAPAVVDHLLPTQDTRDPGDHESGAHLAKARVRGAHHRHLGDTLHFRNDVLHLRRGDIEAAHDVDVLLAVGDAQVAVLGHGADIPGVQPAIADGGGGGLGVVVVTGGDHKSLNPKLPLFLGLHLIAVVIHHHRLDLVDDPPGGGGDQVWCVAAAVDRHKAVVLGETVAGDGVLHPQLIANPVDQVFGHSGGGNHHRIQARQIVAVPLGVVEHRLEHGGRTTHVGDALPLDHRQGGAAVEHRHGVADGAVVEGHHPPGLVAEAVKKGGGDDAVRAGRHAVGTVENPVGFE